MKKVAIVTKKLTNEFRRTYENTRNKKWYDFSEQLQHYQEEYGITTTELAIGLNVSRQSIYNFFKDPERGLSIERVDIFALCDFLSNPEKTIKPEDKQKRIDFKKDNLNTLLDILKFRLDDTFDTKQIATNSFDQIKNPQVRRVLYRLNSNWIKGEDLRTSLASAFLDRINEAGSLKYMSEQDIFDDLEEIKNILEKEFANNSLIDKASLPKYKQEIDKLFNSGKTKYIKAELYELYQSIYEHEIINEPKSNHIEIIDCQFRSISNPIDGIKLFRSDFTDDFIDHVTDSFIESEHKLVNGLRGKYKIKNLSDQDRLDSVIEVAIKCNLSYGEQSHPDIIWRYSSTASPIKNMIAAIKKGLGYPFKVSSFTVRTLGSMDMSLVRSEVTITEPEDENEDEENKEVYQGWWVDINKIMGTLRAVVDASRRWLSSQTDIKQRSDYYNAFQDLAEIDELLFISRASFYSPKPQLNKELLDKCNKYISDTKEYVSKYTDNNKYFKKYHEILENKEHLTSLTKMHIFLLEGDILKASSCLQEAEDILDIGLASNEDPLKNNILLLNASSCVMFYKLLVGDEDFLKQRHWRGEDKGKLKLHVEYNTEKLGEYIRKNHCIDIDSYLYASQFFGTIGYLEFYVSNNSEDRKHLEGDEEEYKEKNAISYLLDAAHYAFRIGHTKRGIHWLAYISRIYCRLDNINKAKKYLKLAKSIGTKNYSMNQLGDIEPLMFYPEFSQIVYSATETKDTISPSLTWSISNLNLAQGEVYFLKGKKSENKNDKQHYYEHAENYFIEALKNSISTGFSRLAADSIYNLYRLSNQQYAIKPIDVFLKLNLAEEKNSFNEKLKALVNEINDEELNKDKTLKKCAKEIWNDWSSANTIANSTLVNGHIFSQEIEKDKFLDVL